MPRNGSGTYNLPPTVNPVVSGTQATANWANTTLNDIANALTDSFTNDGQLPMTGAFRSVDGTISAPGLTFNSETGLGIYRSGSGVLGLATGGVGHLFSAALTTLASTATSVSGTLAVTGTTNLISALSLNGDAGTSGQVLASTAGGANVWYTIPSPPVTSVSGTGSGISVSPTTGDIVISNTGVTSLAAGGGISVSASTGGITVTNTGVTGISAGTGVSVTGSTGSVAVSIGQAIGTGNSPTFTGLTLTGVMSLATGLWHKSTDGITRLYYAPNGDTYFMVGGGDFHFRNSSGNDVATLDMSGNFSALSYNATSDERLKDNIKVIEGALDKVKALKGVQFTWKSSGVKSAGVIAQDVEKVLPEAVVKGIDGEHLAVCYNDLVGLLIQAVKELAAKVGA